MLSLQGRAACATKYLGAPKVCSSTALQMVAASGVANLWTLA